MNNQNKTRIVHIEGCENPDEIRFMQCKKCGVLIITRQSRVKSLKKCYMCKKGMAVYTADEWSAKTCKGKADIVIQDEMTRK